MEIIGVEPSCGCVAVKLEQRRFQPGERGELILDIKPTVQASGAHAWFARVAYRAGERQGTVHLQMQASVRHEVSVEPSVLVWSGTGMQQVTVTDLRSPPLTIKDVHFTSPLVQARPAGTDKGVSRIILQTAANIPPGRHDEMLSIYTSDPLYSPLRIPVTLIGQTRKAIHVTPDQVSQRTAMGQAIPSTLIRLRPAGQEAVAIQAVTADDPAITCTWAQGPFNEATLKIQIHAAKLGDRDLNSAVRVQVGEPVNEILVIPVRVAH